MVEERADELDTTLLRDQTRRMKRRHFLKSIAFTGAAGLILPRTKLFGADAPSNKLNIALIGTWGRGEAHFGGLAKRERRRLVRREREAPGFRGAEVSRGQAIRGLAQVPRPEGHRGGGLLHRRSHPRLRRQLEP